jgi:hypothetical protein
MFYRRSYVLLPGHTTPVDWLWRRKCAVMLVVVAVVVVMEILVCIVFLMFCVDQSDDNVSVVGYYQMSGSNRVASSVVLSLFRSVYPTVPLYIHYDMDHALSASGADLVTYNEKRVDKSAVSKGMYFSTVTAMEDYIQRIKRAASLQKKGWVLLLEDDVWVLAPVKQKDLRYDVTGTCKHAYSRECSRAIETHSTHRPVFRNASCYGAYGGHYINSSRILGLRDNHDLLASLLLAVGGPVASDVLLSAVILSDGGTIGGNPGFYEFFTYTGPVYSNPESGPPNILHEMKMLYWMRNIL